MRSPLLLTLAALSAILLPSPAHAVRPWNSEVTVHPRSLPIAPGLDARGLKPKRLTETKHHGPLLNLLPRGDRLQRYVSEPSKRGGGRSAIDPLKGSRRAAANGAKPVYNNVKPHTEHGRVPVMHRIHSFSPPH